MSQAAQAPQRRPRREADSWATADELEVLGGIGRPKEADWSVLTVERDGASADAPLDALDALGEELSVERMPVERSAGREPRVAEPAAGFAPEPPQASEPEPVFEAAPRERDRETGRRTVVIRGQVTPSAPIAAGPERRRPAPRARDRVGHRPDRIALWAVALGLLLILVAATTANAAPLI